MCALYIINIIITIKSDDNVMLQDRCLIDALYSTDWCYIKILVKTTLQIFLYIIYVFLNHVDSGQCFCFSHLLHLDLDHGCDSSEQYISHHGLSENSFLFHLRSAAPCPLFPWERIIVALPGSGPCPYKAAMAGSTHPLLRAMRVPPALHLSFLTLCPYLCFPVVGSRPD